MASNESMSGDDRKALAEELLRALMAIGVVGEIDGHNVIRRESVRDIVQARMYRLATSKPAAAVPSSTQEEPRPSSTMVETAARNLPQFLKKASFASNVDREAALLCCKTLTEAARATPAAEALQAAAQPVDAPKTPTDSSFLWRPDKCPITRLPFFMWIEHPTMGWVPTYGGPLDSYTIPVMGGLANEPWHQRPLERERYDHDAGYWVEGFEEIPLRVMHEDFLPDHDTPPKGEPTEKPVFHLRSYGDLTAAQLEEYATSSKGESTTPAEPMTERDQFDFARWHKHLGELADEYYAAGQTSQARGRARAALMFHALDAATGWRARSALAATLPPSPKALLAGALPKAELVTVPQVMLDALRFYANGDHFTMADEDAWDTVSGEPPNLWCDEAGTATVEDGSIAAMALRGVAVDWTADEGAAPEPIEGEVLAAAPAQPAEPATQDRLVFECDTHAWSANTMPCPKCAPATPPAAQPEERKALVETGGCLACDRSCVVTGRCSGACSTPPAAEVKP